MMPSDAVRDRACSRCLDPDNDARDTACRCGPLGPHPVGRPTGLARLGRCYTAPLTLHQDPGSGQWRSQ
jgi:hypothetical protein